MKELDIMADIEQTGDWLTRNHDLILLYALNAAAALVIFIVGLTAGGLVARGIRRLGRLRGLDATVVDFLAALARYTVLAFALIAALSRLGVQTTSVIAVLGAAGLAVGLALQGSLSNFAAGVLLVAFRPMRAGEYVDLSGVAGTVVQVQIFSTTLRTPDNKIIVVPNSKIISGNIINFSREPLRRLEFTLSLPPGADIDLVKQTLRGVLANDARLIKDREIMVRLNDFTPAAQNFVVRAWVRNADYWDAYYDLTENFKRVIGATNGLGFARPQMDVFVQR